MPGESDTTELQGLVELLLPVAKEAGDLAVRYVAGHADLAVEKKADESPVTAADRAVNGFLTDRLRALHPEACVIGEEDAEGSNPRSLTPQELAGDVFYLDPIDGTNQFIRGTGEWCVLIGMARDGVPALGVVYRPTTEEMFFASRGGGAWRCGASDLNSRETLRCSARTSCLRAVHSPTNPAQGEAQRIEDFALHTGGSKFPHGSFGLKLLLVSSGVADLYVTSGAACLWDCCAGEAVAREAGVSVFYVDHEGAEPSMSQRLRSVPYAPSQSMYLPRTVVCLPTHMRGQFEEYIDSLQAPALSKL
eukprot:TRINITY_DN33223_c0_g1_i1.p2 TRINITY_DN33223_c0_g1~~TRINITY_DN33223_c0_g1_i1.p2  ORF type:complete len:326 (+),score=109.17 TRINITY_DN33223_c0_g1_i1:62-979(+)